MCDEHVVKPYNYYVLQNDNTPLHNAVRLGNTDIVKMLLREGADVYAKNKVS